MLSSSLLWHTDMMVRDDVVIPKQCKPHLRDGRAKVTMEPESQLAVGGCPSWDCSGTSLRPKDRCLSCSAFLSLSAKPCPLPYRALKEANLGTCCLFLFYSYGTHAHAGTHVYTHTRYHRARVERFLWLVSSLNYIFFLTSAYGFCTFLLGGI